MTRKDLLQLLLVQARTQGFDFRKWYATAVDIPWSGAEHAVDWLARGQRANILLFSHGFARHFFHADDRITFIVPPQTFQKAVPGGGSKTVERKAHLRRSSRNNVWQFHLREMAAATEPLRYIRRFLVVQETLAELSAPQPIAKTAPKKSAPRMVAVDEEVSYDDETLVRDEDSST